MSLRGNEMIWIYPTRITFDLMYINRRTLGGPETGEKVLSEFLTIVLAAVDLKEAVELNWRRFVNLDEFISQCENKLTLLKAEIIELVNPGDPDDEELIFENARIEKDLKKSRNMKRFRNVSMEPKSNY